MRNLSEQDVRDIILGCTVLGTGGGGDPQIGLSVLEEDFREGRTFRLASLSELPDEGYVASPYVCGAISPETEEERKKYARFTDTGVPTPAIAFEKLQDYIGTPFYGVISTELGGANTAYALHIGAFLDKAIVDGDFAGRSVPGVQHNSCNICGIPMTPFAVASKFGDAAVFSDVVDEERAEALIRAMSVVSQNNIGVVDHPMRGKTLKKSVIPGAISMALRIGQILRQSRESGCNPVQKIAEAFDGRVLFRGEVVQVTWDTVGGYTEGDIHLRGSGEYSGEDYRIWFRNENIISWRNGNVDVCVPDLICLMDEDGVPVTNPNMEKGQKVTAFALPAPELWKSERGLELFGPKSFGFDVEYEGIEKR